MGSEIAPAEDVAAACGGGALPRGQAQGAAPRRRLDRAPRGGCRAGGRALWCRRRRGRHGGRVDHPGREQAGHVVAAVVVSRCRPSGCTPTLEGALSRLLSLGATRPPLSAGNNRHGIQHTEGGRSAFTRQI